MCDHYVPPGTPHYCTDMVSFDFGSHHADSLEAIAGSYSGGVNC